MGPVQPLRGVGALGPPMSSAETGNELVLMFGRRRLDQPGLEKLPLGDLHDILDGHHVVSENLGGADDLGNVTGSRR